MSKKTYLSVKVPIAVPTEIVITSKRMDYSLPKLYIPKIAKGDKKVPTLEKPWYVYFYFTNPKTGKKDSNSKFIRKHGINQYKTVSQRKKFGKSLIEAYTSLLTKGYNPYENTVIEDSEIDFTTKQVSLDEAIKEAIAVKKLTWNKNSAAGFILRINKYIEFSKKHNFNNLPTSHLNSKHVSKFLQGLSKEGLSATSVNNYQGAISTIFTQMVKNGDLKHNFVKDIDRLKSKPVKNHPFTNDQINDIKEYLEENDKQLLDYLRCVAYSFLRNREVLRLQSKHIDLNNRLMTDLTKTDSLEKIYIIDQLYDILDKKLKLSNSPEDFVFTPTGIPGPWETPLLKTKVDHYGYRFRPVKKHFGFGKEYGIYSFRHSFALNAYENLLKESNSEQEALSKLLAITRHNSIQSASAYIREKKKMLPKNFSQNITIDF